MTRPGKWGNPFQIGGWFRLEHPGSWRQASRPGERGYTQIADKATALAWFARLINVTRPDLAELRGWNLACWCKEGEPCHGDILLRLANG